MLLGINNHSLKWRKKRRGHILYGWKKFDNPLFPYKSKKKIKNLTYQLSLRAKLISAAILLLVAGGLWFAFYSNFFTVKIFDLRGTGRVAPSDIEKIALEQISRNIFVLWPKKNIFLYDVEDLKTKLTEKYSFDILSVNKKLPGTIIIEYQEKSYVFIWRENDKYYYIDGHGSIIAETSPLEVQTKEYPLIDNLSQNFIIDRQVTAAGGNFDFIIGLSRQIKDLSAEIDFDHLIVDNEQNSVKVVLKSGPKLYFNVDEDLLKQIAKLMILKTEKLKTDFVKKTYIDLRFGDRVYYR